MSGPPRIRSMNVADSDSRPVLGPTGNKARIVETRKPGVKPLKKLEKPRQEVESKDKRVPLSPPQCVTVPSVLRQQDRHQAILNLSMNASCSSDASSDSFNSRASSARGTRQRGPNLRRKQNSTVKGAGKSVEKVGVESAAVVAVVADTVGCLESKKRCAWVTPNTDPCYAAFHDEEWGVPVHDDKKLFELLCLSGALAELTWPAILNKRYLFREIFLDFDPNVVSKLNEKKMVAPGSAATSLLSELKVRAIIENGRQMCKVIDEFGSFNVYMWNFVNHKPIISQFRYPRQVPDKTSKAEVISKDLVKRGFRSVGPTVIYTFMQVAGLTNDHLISCFRFQECIETQTAEKGEKDGEIKLTVNEKMPEALKNLEL
ncbi:probable GMP synthase [glutamine-hydrolyzing] [Benincasa hispida]|uniref:probable GMP synthase [glutamine-hydrolyzing] n=1 Tax=Benincasa hispida TaxID=102211 RepID=UPI0018FFD54B|nr:probable GMP synthase [glutamine-hydrolyzing] [Benincasa hispida]